MIYHTLLLNLLWIWGFYVACRVDFNDDERPSLGYDKDSRMRLWFVKKWAIENYGTYGAKGICTCPPCMSLLHSIPFFIYFLVETSFKNVLFWPFYVGILCGANYFVSLLTNKLER